MFELLLSGFGAVFSLNILVLVTVGVAVGIVFGAVPGLTAVMAIALCLPLTFTMGPAAGLSLLVALYIGATSGGLIAAILLKIPGTPSSIATTRQKSRGSPTARLWRWMVTRRRPTPPASWSRNPRSRHKKLPQYQPVSPPMPATAFQARSTSAPRVAL